MLSEKLNSVFAVFYLLAHEREISILPYKNISDQTVARSKNIQHIYCLLSIEQDLIRLGGPAHEMWPKMYTKQECIPVGCVSSAAVAVSSGGRGGLPQCILGYKPPTGPGTPPTRHPQTRSPPSDQALPQTRHPRDHAPPCGQTHTCENITFATSLRTVNIPVGRRGTRDSGI